MLLLRLHVCHVLTHVHVAGSYNYIKLSSQNRRGVTKLFSALVDSDSDINGDVKLTSRFCTQNLESNQINVLIDREFNLSSLGLSS